MIVPRAITESDIQRLSDQRHLCQQFGCTVFYDEELLDDNWFWPHDGCSIVQYIEAIPGGPRRTWEGIPDLDDHVDSDASSMFQAQSILHPTRKLLDDTEKELQCWRKALRIDTGDVLSLMGRNPVINRNQQDDPQGLAPHLPDDAIDGPLDPALPGRWFTIIVYALQRDPIVGRISSGDLAYFYHQIAQLLQIPAHIQQAPCLVRLNGHLVHQTGPITLQHGDYLRFILGPWNNHQQITSCSSCLSPWTRS